MTLVRVSSCASIRAMKEAAKNEDQMQNQMLDVLSGKPLPTGSQINATVALLNLHQRSSVLVYVTQYLCTNTSHYPMNAETVREAYAHAFAIDSIPVIGEGE